MADRFEPPTTPPASLPPSDFYLGAKLAYQRPPQVRRRPEVRDRTRLPGYMNEARVAEQWDEANPTRGSQFGHPNDEAHLWAWI